MDPFFPFPSSSSSADGAGGQNSANNLNSNQNSKKTWENTVQEKEEGFGEMVGEMRGLFVKFLKKSEEEMHGAKEELLSEKESFEEEKKQVWKNFMQEKQKEYEKLETAKRKSEAEIAAAVKQVAIEREDARKKILDEKQKLEDEREKSKRALTLERERLATEAANIEEERNRIKDQVLATEEIVDLNVGGVTFETSKATLCKQTGSYLEGLLSGREHVGRDRNGRIFIDRDSENFRKILNYLRSDDATIPIPDTPQESETLVREADYYGIRFFPYPLVFACGGHNGYEHLTSR